MTQPSLFADRPQSEEDNSELLASFRTWLLAKGAAEPSAAAEVSQLNTIARIAVGQGRTLSALIERPALAAEVFEQSAGSCGLSTIQTRARAFQKLLTFVRPDADEAIREFRSAFPGRAAKEWHEAGISLPGQRHKQRRRGPTPSVADLFAIVADASRSSPEEGGLAGLLCFSGLELDEVRDLRWSDLKWRDDGNTPLYEVVTHRRGERAHSFIVADGAQAILRLALRTGLERDAFLFPGRATGEAISDRALRYRMKLICTHAGWPDVTRPQLTSAFVLFLSQCGMDDHAIKIAIGRKRVATVDRLLRRHRQLQAQRDIDARTSFVGDD